MTSEEETVDYGSYAYFFKESQTKIGEQINNYSNIDASESNNKLYIRPKISNNSIRAIFGGAKNDTLVAGDGGVSISGGAGNDEIYGGSGNDYLDGGEGNDVLTGGGGQDIFVYSAGADSISGYTDVDVIQFATEPTAATFGANGVLFTISEGNSILVQKTEPDAKTMTIKYKVGDALTTATYLENAQIEGDTLILAADASGTCKASDFTQGENVITKVDASAVTENALTFEGFTSITGFKANKDKVNVTAAPTDASINGNDLVITVGSDTITVAGAAAQTVSMAADGKNYTAAVGEITNTADKIVTLTGNYTKTSYTADAEILTVTAANVANALSITGNAQANYIVAGNAGGTLSGGAGADSLIGGTGKDVFVYSAGADSISGYNAANDLISLSGVAALTDVDKVGISSNTFTFTFEEGSNVLTVNSDAASVKLSDGTTYTNDLILQGAGVSLRPNATTFDGTQDSLKSVVTVDASKVTVDVAITDNAKNNYVTFGSKINTFNYAGGADSISGYDSADVINLSGVTPLTDLGKVSKSGSDLVLKFNNTDSLTFKDKTAASIKSGDAVYKYDENKSIALNATAIWLGNAYGNSYNSTYTTVDASARTNAITIAGGASGKYLLGGASADSITATAQGASLYGYGGNDTLTAGANALFNGGTGKNTIILSGANASVNVNDGDDLISIGSGVSSLDIFGFESGDSLKFASAVASIYADNSGNFVASLNSGSPVTIGGLSEVSKEFSWKLGTGANSIVATYAERALNGD